MKSLIALLAFALCAHAQKQIVASTPNYTGLGQDLNAASFVQVGSGSPTVACNQIGIDQYYDLLNEIWYGCTAAGNPGTWAQIGGSSSGPSANAFYLVTKSANAPTNAFNLGGLSTGLLKLSVASGVATPSTAVAGTDYQSPITTGTTAQYFRGDLSLATFPTTWAWANLTGVPTLTNTVFGRSGNVTAQSGDYTTSQVTEAGNLYFTSARVLAAMAGLYQSPITTGSTAQYLRGDLSLATFPTTWAWGNLTGVPSTLVQTSISNTYSSGTTQDFHAAAHTLPAVSGTGSSKPSSCSVGEIYFATDAAAGQNLFYCTASNTWTQEAIGSSTSPQTGTLTYNGSAPCSGTFPCQQTVTLTGITLANSPFVVLTDSTTKYSVDFTLCGWTSSTVCIQLASAATVNYVISTGGSGPQGPQGIQGPQGNPGTVTSVTHTCTISNDTQSTTVLTAAQLSGQCEIGVSGTIVEVDVVGGTGVITNTAAAPTFSGGSSIQIGKWTPSTNTSNTGLLSGVLSTLSGKACAYTSTSTTCPSMGITSSGTVTVSTTAVTKGDVLFVSSGTADGVQTWFTVTIVYTASN